MLRWKDIQSGWNNLSEGITNFVKGPVSDLAGGLRKHEERLDELFTGNNDYSDFVSTANENTDGWYSTIMDSIPIVNNIHNSVLGRDSAIDYLNNTGLSWSDIPGYNTSKLTGRTSANVNEGLRSAYKIADGQHDLYAFYAGEPDIMYG